MKSFKLLLSVLIASLLFFTCNTQPAEEKAEEAAEEMAEAAESAYDEADEAVTEAGDAIAEAVDSDEEGEIIEVEAMGAEGGEFYTDEETGEIVYTFLMEENRPTFKDGSLQEYLGKHLVYPIKARENKSEGTVVVDFVVGSDGVVRNPQVVKSHDDELLNTEALAVVSKMPEWNPGLKDGTPVAYKYSLPIQFVFEEEN